MREKGKNSRKGQTQREKENKRRRGRERETIINESLLFFSVEVNSIEIKKAAAAVLVWSLVGCEGHFQVSHFYCRGKERIKALNYSMCVVEVQYLNLMMFIHSIPPKEIVS